MTTDDHILPGKQIRRNQVDIYRTANVSSARAHVATCTAHQTWTSVRSKCVVPCKDVPFGGLNDFPPNFGDQSSKD